MMYALRRNGFLSFAFFPHSFLFATSEQMSVKQSTVCAFETFEALQRSCDSLLSMEGSKTCRLIRASHQEEEQRPATVFALLVETHSVRVSRDLRDRMELLQLFRPHNLSPEVIDRVWNGGHTRSFTACLDVLSSLIASHGSVMLGDLEFSLESIAWPALSGSADDSSESGWSVVSVSDLADLSLLDHQHVAGKKEAEDDWDLISSASGDAHSGVLSVATTPPPVSYKSVLLTSSASDYALPVLKAASSSRRQWSPPQIVVEPVLSLRISGKLYEDSLSVRLLRQLKRSDDSDFDEDADEEYFCSVMYARASAGVTRYRSIHRLKPAVLDKKMRRIAAK